MAEQHTKKAHRKDHKNTSPSLGQLAGRSALWQIAGGGWQTIVRLGASTILARKLDPEDFGLFGMALLMSQMIMVLTNLGMGTGIVAKKDIDEKDLNTCFWSMVGVRALMFALAETTAPIAAVYFKEPRITAIVRVVGFNFLFTIPGVVSNTILIKELKFKYLVIIRGISTLFESTLAVILVLATNLAYWALVYPMLLATLFAECAIFFITGWRPKLIFDKERFRYLWRYGINGLVFSVFNYLSQNLDYYIVGRLLGASALGFYEFSYRIPHLVIDRISRPVGGVVFPTLAKVQDNNELIVKGYVTAVKSVILISYPLLGFLLVMAHPVVSLLWGERWLPIVNPLQILSVVAALRCIFQPLGSIYYAKQRPELPAIFSIIRTFFTGILVWFLGYYWGLIGVAYAMLLSVLPTFIFGNIAFSLCETSIYRVLKDLADPICVTGLATIFLFLSNLFFHGIVEGIKLILLNGLLYCIIYFTIMYFLFKGLFKEIQTNAVIIFSFRR